MEEIINFLAGDKLDFTEAFELFYKYRPKRFLSRFNQPKVVNPAAIIRVLEEIAGIPYKDERKAINKHLCQITGPKTKAGKIELSPLSVTQKPISPVKKETNPEFSDLPPEIQRIKVEQANLIHEREGMKQAICEMPEDNKTPEIVESRRLIGLDIDDLTAKIDVLAKQLEIYNTTGEIKEPKSEPEEEDAETNVTDFSNLSEEKIKVELANLRSLISMTKKKD